MCMELENKCRIFINKTSADMMLGKKGGDSRVNGKQLVVLVLGERRK